VSKEMSDWPIVGRVFCTDGSERDVFEDAEGRQYVLGEDDEPAFAQWLPPADEAVIMDIEPLQ
jgi:hypothetical protein